MVEFVAQTITTEWTVPGLEPLAPQDVLELWYTADTAKLAYQEPQGGWAAEPQLPAEGEYLCVQVFASTNRAQTVVQRDSALLKPDEVLKNWPQVLQSIQAELETWAKHGCISRKARAKVRGSTDVTWVLKWKHAQTV